MNCKEDEHTDYVARWMREIQSTPLPYREPTLVPSLVEFVKLACKNLMQDEHVFVMTCDVLETYLSIKKKRKEKVHHKVLLVISVISILSKYVGEISDLRVKFLHTFYSSVTDEDIPINLFKMEEVDVMNTLGNRLPLFSAIDDMKLLHKVYVQPLNLRVDLMPLCQDILCLIYVHKKTLFHSVRKYYEHSREALLAFVSVYTNKAYLPVGVIVSAVKLTLVKNFIDINKMIGDFSCAFKIHSDHFRLLVSYVVLLAKNKEIQTRGDGIKDD